MFMGSMGTTSSHFFSNKQTKVYPLQAEARSQFFGSVFVFLFGGFVTRLQLLVSMESFHSVPGQCQLIDMVVPFFLEFIFSLALIYILYPSATVLWMNLNAQVRPFHFLFMRKIEHDNHFGTNRIIHLEMELQAHQNHLKQTVLQKRKKRGTFVFFNVQFLLSFFKFFYVCLEFTHFENLFGRHIFS